MLFDVIEKENYFVWCRYILCCVEFTFLSCFIFKLKIRIRGIWNLLEEYKTIDSIWRLLSFQRSEMKHLKYHLILVKMNYKCPRVIRYINVGHLLLQCPWYRFPFVCPFVRVSHLCYPPWILKQGGLESSGKRQISSIGKTKRITLFLQHFFLSPLSYFKKKGFFLLDFLKFSDFWIIILFFRFSFFCIF